ncbi:right-handed parallel beta-helix repeat-containing protein [Streptomyces lydicus]|uniref:right-handed parallel beta-helix repeat-containing protein n=1 Tax=Streptomyces lydicus TaxID=47763 RepID=UPI002870B37C|nr:right-handed parallel beta-helix repeat-containing protein [Streptomyces lydicus]
MSPSREGGDQGGPAVGGHRCSLVEQSVQAAAQVADELGGAATGAVTQAWSSGIILAGSGNTLKNSKIAYSAGNGVALGGSGNTVTNNNIHDTDYTGTYAAGINLFGQDATATRNIVRISGRSAVNIDTYPIVSRRPSARIAYNDLSGTGYFSADQAPIYACCLKAGLDMKESRIDHNWIHDDHQDAKRQVFYGIYLDNGTSNAQVDHNVIWNISGGRGVGVNGGTENQVVNNTELPNAYIHGSSTSNNADLNNLSVNSSATFVDPVNGNYSAAANGSSDQRGKG